MTLAQEVAADAHLAAELDAQASVAERCETRSLRRMCRRQVRQAEKQAEEQAELLLVRQRMDHRRALSRPAATAGTGMSTLMLALKTVRAARG